MNASLFYTLKTILCETFEREFLFGLQSELFGTGYCLRFNMIFVNTENHLFKCFVSSVVDGVNSVTRDSPVSSKRLDIYTNKRSCPCITLISWIEIQSSKVIETTDLMIPSEKVLRTMVLVIFTRITFYEIVLSVKDDQKTFVFQRQTAQTACQYLT